MIPFVDEVLAGEPRYTITHADTTTEVVSIELTTPVTTQGTEMNKRYFDSIKSYIDLHGKYNEATLVQSATLHTGAYIPSMSRATGGFSVSSSNTASQYNPVDQSVSLSNEWKTNVAAGGQAYWEITFPTNIRIREMTINLYTAIYNVGRFDIQASVDNTNWTTLASFEEKRTKKHIP